MDSSVSPIIGCQHFHIINKVVSRRCDLLLALFLTFLVFHLLPLLSFIKTVIINTLITMGSAIHFLSSPYPHHNHQDCHNSNYSGPTSQTPALQCFYHSIISLLLTCHSLHFPSIFSVIFYYSHFLLTAQLIKFIFNISFIFLLLNCCNCCKFTFYFSFYSSLLVFLTGAVVGHQGPTFSGAPAFAK